MQIVAGDKVLMEFSTFGDRFLSIVTDIKDDGRLLVYSPITAPIIQRLESDPRAQVRFAMEGRLHGFRTEVLNSVVGPGSILELAAPGEVFDAEDRNEPRCPCRFPATVVDGEKSAQAVVEDMSANCSRVRFLNGGLPFVEDTKREVRLTFHPFEVGDGYSVDCVVRNAFMKDGTRYAVLTFKPEEADARSRIKQFVEAQLCCGIPRL